VLDAGLGRLPDDGTWNFGIALLVETAILLGRTDLGAPLAEALERWPFPHFYIGTSYGGATARLRGNVAHLAGNDDEAMALYEQAITDHQTLGAVPWLAETRLDQAQLCLDRGEPERAAAYARAALDDIGDLPLTRRKNRAVELLAQADQWKDAPHRVLRSSLAANPSSCPGTAAK
jgi:tetratricopeptide (TPR) repeat protein